jgi:hypothetical protein
MFFTISEGKDKQISIGVLSKSSRSYIEYFLITRLFKQKFVNSPQNLNT